MLLLRLRFLPHQMCCMEFSLNIHMVTLHTLQKHQRIRTNATVSKDSEIVKITKWHGGQWEFSLSQTSSLSK